MDEEERTETLREALESAHETIEKGIAVLENVNRFITLNDETFAWIKDAKELLKSDERLL